MSYFLLAIVFLAPSYLIRFQVFGIPTTLLEILIYLAFVFGVWQAKTDRQIVWPKKQFLIPIILILIGAIIGIIISPDKRTALGELKAFFVDPLLFYFLILNFGLGREQRIIILRWLIFGGAVVSLLAIAQFFWGQVTPEGRTVGIFGYSPNYLGLYLAPIAVIAFWFLVKKIDVKLQWAHLFSFVLMAIAIYLSGSRGAIIAVGFGLIYALYLMLSAGHKQYKKTFTIIFMSLIVIFSFIFIRTALPDLRATPDSGRLASSNNIRYEILKTTVKEILPKNWLFGVGLGNYQSYFTELTRGRVNYPEFIAPRALTPHNLFLAFWLNTGIIGFAGFIWLLVSFFRSNIAQNKFTLYRWIVFSAMIVILVHGLVDTPYFKNDLSLIFWTLIGLVA